MPQLQPKQIQKVLSGYIKITGVTVISPASSIVVTSTLTSALTTAGYNSSSVPLTASTDPTVNGVSITSPGNRLEVYDSTTKSKISSGSGSEVYGRLTFATSVYTLSFYYLNGGTETSYNFNSNTTIDFDFVYRYRFHEFPSDAFVSIVTKNVYQDVQGVGSVEVNEIIAVTSTNTLANLTTIPAYPTRTKMYVNGKVELPLGGSPAFSLSSNTVTWNSSNAGYILETTDFVAFTYYI